MVRKVKIKPKSIRFYKGEWQSWNHVDQSWSGRIDCQNEEEAIQIAAIHIWECRPEEITVVKPYAPKQKKVADNIYLLIDTVRGKKRNLPYRVHIHYKGQQYVEMCRTLPEAKQWRDDKWTYLRKPKELQEIAKMEGTPVDFLVMKHKEEAKDIDAYMFITHFCTLSMVKKSIYDFDRKDATDYIKRRLSETYIRKGWKEAKPVLPSTVEREVTVLKAIWNAAKNSGEYLG
jgi:hypothetical protein